MPSVRSVIALAVMTPIGSTVAEMISLLATDAPTRAAAHRKSSRPIACDAGPLRPACARCRGGTRPMKPIVPTHVTAAPQPRHRNERSHAARRCEYAQCRARTSPRCREVRHQASRSDRQLGGKHKGDDANLAMKRQTGCAKSRPRGGAKRVAARRCFLPWGRETGEQRTDQGARYWPCAVAFAALSAAKASAVIPRE
jgi:hypothetical protein